MTKWSSSKSGILPGKSATAASRLLATDVPAVPFLCAEGDGGKSFKSATHCHNTCRESFIELQSWLKELRECGPNDIVLCVCGNKTDLSSRRVRLATLEALITGRYHETYSALFYL